MSEKIDRPNQCRLCHKALKTLEIVGDFVYAGNPQQKFYRCQDCDIAFLYPAMTEKEEQKFYNKEFEKFMEKRAGQDFDWSGPEVHFKTSHKHYRCNYSSQKYCSYKPWYILSIKRSLLAIIFIKMFFYNFKDKKSYTTT